VVTLVAEDFFEEDFFAEDFDEEDFVEEDFGFDETYASHVGPRRPHVGLSPTRSELKSEGTAGAACKAFESLAVDCESFAFAGTADEPRRKPSDAADASIVIVRRLRQALRFS